MDERWPDGLSDGEPATAAPRQAQFRELTKITLRQRRFATIYATVALGDATRAYKLAGYGGSPEAQRSSAARLLTLPAIQEVIAEELEKQRGQLQAEANFALVALGQIVRVNIQDTLDERGRTLPLGQLRPEVAAGIRAVTPGKYGMRLEFVDRLRAIELVLRVAGRLKDVVRVDPGPTLEAILADSWKGAPLRTGAPLEAEACAGLPAAAPQDDEEQEAGR